MSEPIILNCQNHLAIITFNHPERLNAFNREMADRFEMLCEQIKNDDTIRAVLIRGNGETFMSGTDLYELNQHIDSLAADATFLIRKLNSAILMLREMNKPVLAAVHGFVMGVGMSIMLAADFAMATTHTKFAMGYNRIGLPAAGACSYLLPRIIGGRRAMELAILSDIFDTAVAQNLGLVNWVVAPEDFEEQLTHILDRFINGPIVAFLQTKHLINSGWQNKLSAQLELEAEAFTRCANTKDFKTAIKAYVNKVTPEFEGR